jgi:N-acyl-phosphatidylethanolamine-hydrolysing phospholipase D
MTDRLHHTPGGGFRNPWPGTEPQGLANLLRWFAERHTTRRPPPDPDPSVFPLAEPQLGQARKPGDLAVTWIGHSTALLEFSDCTVLTDPIWGQFASPVPAGRLRRWVPVPIGLDALPRVDLVLLSHNHYDHLDARTVRDLAVRQPQIEWCVPLGLGTLLERLGVTRVQEFDWWDDRSVGPARVVATPAQHFSARGVHDRNRTLWCGFTVRTGGRAVYFAGDTAYHPEFRQIGHRLGPFDVQLLPVGAYEPRWFMRVVHMNPEEAIRAFGEVAGGTEPSTTAGVEGSGAVLVPIHWGTFKLTDEPMDEPPRRARMEWAAAGRPPERLWLLQHGETRVLGG